MPSAGLTGSNLCVGEGGTYCIQQGLLRRLEMQDRPFHGASVQQQEHVHVIPNKAEGPIHEQQQCGV